MLHFLRRSPAQKSGFENIEIFTDKEKTFFSQTGKNPKLYFLISAIPSGINQQNNIFEYPNT